MPLPPPDPSLIETRLMVVAEMLERAVDEVQRVMGAIKGEEILSDRPALLPPPMPDSRPDSSQTHGSTDAARPDSTHR